MDGSSIVGGVLSRHDPLSRSQVLHFTSCLKHLIDIARNAEGECRPAYWAEWHLLIGAAYACGFVTSDEDETKGRMSLALIVRQPEYSAHLPFSDIRALIQHVIRTERWSGSKDAYGENVLWPFLRSPAADMIAARLEVLAWAE